MSYLQHTLKLIAEVLAEVTRERQQPGLRGS